MDQRVNFEPIETPEAIVNRLQTLNADINTLRQESKKLEGQMADIMNSFVLGTGIEVKGRIVFDPSQSTIVQAIVVPQEVEEDAPNTEEARQEPFAEEVV